MINLTFFLLVGLGITFSMIRLIKGKTVFDRIVSMDMINVCVIGILVLIAVIHENELYLDVALIYGLLGFLETIVFAKFLEGRS